jgi:hypothetical protein
VRLHGSARAMGDRPPSRAMCSRNSATVIAATFFGRPLRAPVTTGREEPGAGEGTVGFRPGGPLLDRLASAHGAVTMGAHVGAA